MNMITQSKDDSVNKSQKSEEQDDIDWKKLFLSLSVENELLKKKLEKKETEAIPFSFAPMSNSFKDALSRYLTTGLLIKSVNTAMENSITKLMEENKFLSPCLFAYLDGSSGVGKTQSAFSLKRKTLYLPFDQTQDIYKCFYSITSVVQKAINLDMHNLQSDIALQPFDTQQLYSTSHLSEVLNVVSKTSFQYYTISVLMKLMLNFKDQRDEYNVYLGVDKDEMMNIEPMTIADGRMKLAEFQSILIFIDEVPAKTGTNNKQFEACLFLRNIIRSVGLLCLLSGTESTLMNVVSTVNGSRYNTKCAWVGLLLSFPQLVLNNWQENLSLLSEYEQWLLATTRPLFINWFFECCQLEMKLSPHLLTCIKAKIQVMKPQFVSEEGVKAQICHVFQASFNSSREDLSKFHSIQNLDNSKWITSHFAYLKAPVGIDDSDDCVVLYNHGSFLGDVTGNIYQPKSTFKLLAEDEFLGLVCLNSGLMKGATTITSSYALRTIRSASNVRFVNTEAKKNDGHALEEECMISFVLASHRYTTFAGTYFLVWLSRVVGELSPYEDFIATEISRIPSDLNNRLKEVMVGILSPPNCSWSGRHPIEMNLCNLRWCKNSEMVDSKIVDSDGCSISMEMKDETDGFGGHQFVVVAKKFHGRSSTICVLVCCKFNDISRDTISELPKDMDYYVMRSLDEIVAIQSMPSSKFNKIMIVISLEDIYPGRAYLMNHQQ